MRKTFLVWVCIIMLGVMVAFAGQEEKTQQEVVIKEDISFWYASMDFAGPLTKMRESIPKFMDEFFKQGLMPAGSFLGIYHNNPREVKPGELKWAVGFIVTKGTEVKAPLKIAEFKYKFAAVYKHIGPYKFLSQAYDKILKHAEANGYKTLWPTYDKYLNNPQQVKPEELETEIIVPLEKK